ncbi:MAG: hypothetical protein SFV81_03865 [Pirellulaceae bacterium]|nr:hypothetical protein [Pirellulaceae bacterium]
MYDYIRTMLGEKSWILAIATIAFFTIKGLLWIAVPMLVIRWKRWFVRDNRLAIRKP